VLRLNKAPSDQALSSNY